MIRAFVQARMSSSRFPGKVLAPFQGRALLAHVIDRVASVIGQDAIVVTTSTAASDDPLAAYVRDMSVALFRGPLEDVFERFRLCTAAHPCEWILRVSADSPLLDPGVVRRVVEHRQDECDLVTTIRPRTFPKGHNAELIRAALFATVDRACLSAGEREHVTAYFYRHPDRFRIVNIDSGQPELARLSFAVDTPDDLRRLERLVAPSGIAATDDDQCRQLYPA